MHFLTEMFKFCRANFLLWLFLEISMIYDFRVPEILSTELLSDIQ
jgi:hypothetical protein